MAHLRPLHRPNFPQALLVIFLCFIPFLLLLAEFAAFGRSQPAAPATAIRLAVDRTGITGPEQNLLSCMEGEQGHPIELVEGSKSASYSDRLLFKSNAAPRLQFVSSVSAENRLLAESILRICLSTPYSLRTTISTTRAAAAAPAGDFLARFAPGLALFGALFLSQALASLIWRDQENAVLSRLLTFPIRRSALVFGPLLFLALGAGCALIIMLAGVSFAVNLPAVRAPLICFIALGFALFAAGLQLFIGLWAGSPRAAQAVSASAIMMLAFFGGGFVPLQVYPPFLRSIAYALPNGSAQAGLTELLSSSARQSAIALPMITLWLWAGLAAGAAVYMRARRSA